MFAVVVCYLYLYIPVVRKRVYCIVTDSNILHSSRSVHSLHSSRNGTSLSGTHWNQKFDRVLVSSANSIGPMWLDLIIISRLCGRIFLTVAMLGISMSIFSHVVPSLADSRRSLPCFR